MPEGFSTISDLRVVVDASTEKLEGGLAMAHNMVQRFAAEGTSSLSGFDKVIGAAAAGVEGLRGRLNVAMAAMSAVGAVIANVGAVIEQGAKLTGTEAEFEDLASAASELESALAEGLQTAFGLVAQEALEADGALSAWSATNADAEAASESLAGKLQTGLAAALRTVAAEVRMMAPAGAQSIETLEASITRAEGELARLNERFATGKQEVKTYGDLVRALSQGTPEQWEAARTALEKQIAGLKEQAAMTRKRDEEALVAGFAPTVTVAEPDIMEGFNALAKFEKDVESVETRLKALSMSAGDAAAYTARYQFNTQIKGDLDPVQSAKLDELVSRKAAAEAGLKAAEDAKRSAETSTRRESGIDDVIGRATREVELERVRAGALGRTREETERLLFEERLLQQIREKGREPTEDEVLKIRAMAAERGKLAQSTAEMKGAMDAVGRYGDVLSNAMERAFSNWTNTGKFSVKDMVGSMLKDLAMLEFRRGVMAPLFGAGGGGSEAGGGLFSTLASSLFGGFREFGGDVEAGKAYVVGEKRPELFIPSTAGRIEPSLRGGAGGDVHVYVHASPEFNTRIETAAQGVVARNAPSIVGASVEATRRGLPGMMGESQRRKA